MLKSNDKEDIIYVGSNDKSLSVYLDNRLSVSVLLE